MNLSTTSGMNDLVPSEFYLGQNYPNPFSEKTTIKFCVAYKTKVKLKVFNSEGKMIKKLLDEEKDAGTYEIVFQSAIGNSSKGVLSGLANETYFYRLEAGDYKSEKKMLMMK